MREIFQIFLQYFFRTWCNGDFPVFIAFAMYIDPLAFLKLDIFYLEVNQLLYPASGIVQKGQYGKVAYAVPALQIHDMQHM